MKFLARLNFLFLLLFYLSCANPQDKNNKQEVTIDSTKISHLEEQLEENQLSESSKQIIKEQLSKSAMQSKRTSTTRLTKTISNPGDPSTLRIDTILVSFEEWKFKNEKSGCVYNKLFTPGDFNNSIIEQFEFSSEQTNKFDGKSFCVRHKKLAHLPYSKLIYRRNEGGHITDMVELISVYDKNKIYILPLFFKTSRDGYVKIIESKFAAENAMIGRKITERFGWSNLHPDSLANQPQRISEETYQIQNNGKIVSILNN